MLENPYTIDNMNNALYILLKSEPLATQIDIRVTNKYIRFLPKDSLEYTELMSEETLILFPYPLLQKIKQVGSYYHDNSLSKDQITWQYAVVPVDYDFPNVKFELISDVYLPFKERQNATYEMKIILAKLEDIALKLVGIEDKQVQVANKTSAYNWYYPKASIKILGSTNEPIIDAKLVVNHLLHVDWTHTGQSGVGIIDDNFLYEVQYKLMWKPKNNLFRLSLSLFTLFHLGPYQNSDWNFDILPNSSNNDLSIKNAMVYLAAHDFMYKPNIRGGITLPSRPGFTTDIVTDNYNTAPGYSTSNAGFANINIIIMFTSSKDIRDCYTVTIHELGHMSHSVEAQNNYNTMAMEYLNPNNFARSALESWANGVEWYICIQKYQSRYKINPPPFNNSSYDDRSISVGGVTRAYTQIVADLIDFSNEGRIQTAIFDNDMTFHKSVKFSVIDNTIYYTPDINNQCTTAGSFMDNNGLCNLMELPSDPYLEYEILQNGEIINFFTWDQAGGLPYDRVGGYSITQIQEAMYGSEDWHSWRQNLYDLFPNNPTRQYLNELFSNWY